MKATGIVRRIDDLGRVVIPKEIRRTLKIREGEPMEIFTENAGTPEEYSYRWVEVEKPKKIKGYRQLGAVRMIDDGKFDTIEINGRYFKQQEVKKDNTKQNNKNKNLN